MTKAKKTTAKAVPPLTAIDGGAAPHFDGYKNLLTGLGLRERDKRLSTTFTSDAMSWGTAQELWRGNDMASKIITKVPKEALRRGFDVRIQGDDAEGSKEIEEALEQQLAKLDTSNKVYDAMCYERAYGGGALLIGANDGNLAKPGGLKEPLDETKLQSIDFLNAIPAQELYVSAWYSNPLAPKYGTPARYRLMPQGIADASAYNLEIHESRLLIFPGVVVSRQQTQQNQGWGDSVLVRVNEVLRDFNATWGGVANLLQDFAQAIYKIDGLATLVANNRTDKVLERLQLIDIMRSVIRGVMLDSKEDFERKSTSLAGLPEILQQFMLRLAGAAEMPVSLLIGQSPAGLNATGASDIRFFYDDVASEQTQRLLPRLNRLVRLLQLCKKGPTKGIEQPKWSVIFRPLWQMTEQETEELRKKVADRDKIYIDAKVLTPEEVTQSRFGGDAWSAETTIDLEARSKAAPEPAPSPTTPPNPNTPKKDAARLDAGHGGVMVALYPPTQTALDLVVPGGERAEELHLTLCYLGKVTDFDAGQLNTLRGVVAGFAKAWSSLSGQISGLGLFCANTQTQGLDVLWGAVDVPGLLPFREALTQALSQAAIPYSQQNSYQPHITLIYLEPSEMAPIRRLSPRPIAFSSVSLVMGDTRVDYPLEAA